MSETNNTDPAAADAARLAELIRAKRAAGLSESHARTVALAQLAHDAARNTGEPPVPPPQPAAPAAAAPATSKTKK